MGWQDESKKVAELRIVYHLRPESESSYVLDVEANVIGTDDVVLDRRHTWRLGYVRRTKTAAFLSFERNSPRTSRFKIRAEFRSMEAMNSLMKVERRISDIVAPKHLNGVRGLECGKEMFEEIAKQMTVLAVMGS